MISVRLTPTFIAWVEGLSDGRAKGKIVARLRRLTFGNYGDVRPVGEGVSELRIDHGPGYRVYLVQRGDELIVVLCGGDKRRQDQDIARAKQMARDLKE